MQLFVMGGEISIVAMGNSQSVVTVTSVNNEEFSSSFISPEKHLCFWTIGK